MRSWPPYLMCGRSSLADQLLRGVASGLGIGVVTILVSLLICSFLSLKLYLFPCLASLCSVSTPAVSTVTRMRSCVIVGCSCPLSSLSTGMFSHMIWARGWFLSPAVSHQLHLRLQFVMKGMLTAKTEITIHFPPTRRKCIFGHL